MKIININSYKGKKAKAVFGNFLVPVIVGEKVLDYNLVKYYCEGCDGVTGRGFIKEKDLQFDVL